MTTLTIYDPAMCCSTGVCGQEIDQRLVNFAADLDWLKAQGAKVRRINLSQEPMEFVTQPAVKALMDATGGDGLPAILVGEQIVSQGRYPSRSELSAIAEIGRAATAVQDQGTEAKSSCCSAATAAPVVEAANAECCGGNARTYSDSKAKAG